MATVTAGSHQGEIDENFLLCGICSERYKNAKILPCLHSFCEPCLGKLAEKSGTITCPICRRSHELPASGVTGIDNNSFLNDLVELFMTKDNSVESRKCEICRRGDQTKRCIECSMDICDDCATCHQRIPSIKTHRLVSMDEYMTAKFIDPASVQPPAHCTQHLDCKLEFYCDTCKKVICSRCVALDHPTTEHKFKCVKEAATDYTKDLMAMIDKAKMKEMEAKHSKTAITEVSESLDQCFQKEEGKMKEHIRKTIEDITRLIQEQGNNLLKELKVEYDTRKILLNAQLKELDIIEDDLLSTREYAEKLVQYGNSVQLMTTKKGIVTQMTEMLKLETETETEPATDDYMEFQPYDDFCQEKRLGVIQTSMYKLVDVPDFRRVDEEIVVTVAMCTATLTDSAGNDNKHISALLTSPDNNSEKVEVTGNNGGTMTLKVYAKTEGENELSVSLCKKPVQGSPVRIKVIPKKGLMCKFGEYGTGVGQLRNSYGVTLTRRGDVLVCDHGNDRSQLFTVDGRYLSGCYFVDMKPLPYLFDAATSASGNLFYVDDNNNQIIVCDEIGKVIKCFGKGKILSAYGIAVSPIDGRVYVVDGSCCIHIFDQDGNYIKAFGSKGSKEGEFNSPWFICIDDKGNVYVSDSDNHRIQVFNADGHFLYSFGSEGSGDGQLSSPHGVAVDKHGYVYVSDSGNNRIVKYESEGQFVCRVDSVYGGLKSPRGIIVTNDDPFGKVVVVDEGNPCIKVFAQ